LFSEEFVTVVLTATCTQEFAVSYSETTFDQTELVEDTPVSSVLGTPIPHFFSFQASSTVLLTISADKGVLIARWNFYTDLTSATRPIASELSMMDVSVDSTEEAVVVEIEGDENGLGENVLVGISCVSNIEDCAYTIGIASETEEEFEPTEALEPPPTPPSTSEPITPPEPSTPPDEPEIPDPFKDLPSEILPPDTTDTVPDSQKNVAKEKENELAEVVFGVIIIVVLILIAVLICVLVRLRKKRYDVLSAEEEVVPEPPNPYVIGDEEEEDEEMPEEEHKRP
jgi:hypothetical protein